MLSRLPIRTGVVVLFLLGSVASFAACPSVETTSIFGFTTGGRFNTDQDNPNGSDVCEYDPADFANNLSVRSGRTLTIYGDVTITGDFDILGTLNLYGTLTVEGTITSGGGGTINVFNGGTLNANDGLATGLIAGFTVQSGGTVHVTGDVDMGIGAIMDVQGDMTVTGDFSSTLYSEIGVTNGGYLNVQGDFNNNSRSTITVGDGSTLEVGETFNNNNRGTLVIEDEGTVIAGDYNNSGGGACEGDRCSILPVELLSFEAALSPSGVVTLSWSTATEINNEGFYIQKAPALSDELQWEDIRFVEGNGNKESLSTYTCTDEYFTQDAYYRLKQVDYDGQFEYHDMVFVGFPMDAGINVFPNPFTDRLYIQLREGGYHVSIRDLYGKEHFFGAKLSAVDLKQAVERSAISLDPGTYILIIRGEDEVYTQRIIKNR